MVGCCPAVGSVASVASLPAGAIRVDAIVHRLELTDIGEIKGKLNSDKVIIDGVVYDRMKIEFIRFCSSSFDSITGLFTGEAEFMTGLSISGKEEADFTVLIRSLQ